MSNAESQPTVLRVVKILHWVFLGLLFIPFAVNAVIAGVLWYRTHTFLSKAVTVGGQVIQYEPEFGTRLSIFAYTDKSGDVHKSQTTWASQPPAFNIGDDIKVAYDPAKPDDGRVMAFWDMWGLTLIFGFFAAVILLGMLLAQILYWVIIYFIKRQNRPAITSA